VADVRSRDEAKQESGNPAWPICVSRITTGRRSFPQLQGGNSSAQSCINELNMRKRLLVLAHREELLLQAEEKFRSIDPGLKVGVERADAYATDDSKVVIYCWFNNSPISRSINE